MDETVEHALGRAWHDDAPWELLTRLTERDRFGGHPGERAAADHVRTALAEAGVADLSTDPFEMTRWTRGETTLAVDTRTGDERTFEALALPYSPAGDVTGQLVDVGYGTPDEIDNRDVADSVAIARTGTPADADRRVHRMEKAGHAADAGCAGFVFANHRPGQLPPTGSLQFGQVGPMPAVGVSHETGAWLREYADGDATARLCVDATTGRGESQNVVGRLGPDTDERVLVVAHYDAHDVGEGALDNGCGVAVLLGAVRALAEMDLPCGLSVAAVGCEELGLLGSSALAERLDTESLRAVVNVDGAGRFRNLRALTHTSSGVEDAVESVCEQVGHPVETSARPHAYSDHWPFLRRGVPAIQLHSERPDDEGHWERGWTHTRADTREKADSRIIREHAMLTALVVRELTRREVSVSVDRVRERLRDIGARPGMRAAGVWPAEWD